MANVLVVSACATAPTQPYLETFRWGVGPDALGPHVEIVRDEWIAKRAGRCYRRLFGGSIVEGVASRDTEYCFNRGSLYAVRTYFDGEQQRQQWLQWLTEFYGKPPSTVNVDDAVGWGNDNVGVYLRHVTANSYGIEDSSTVTWRSVRHMPVIVWKICNPWTSDFQTCIEQESRRIQTFDAR